MLSMSVSGSLGLSERWPKIHNGVKKSKRGRRLCVTCVYLCLIV
jgi:hypothetical protein